MKYDEKFYEKWEQERKKGVKRYYLSNMPGIIFIIIGFLCGTLLSKKEIIVEYLFISLSVIALFPILSWCINEIRFKNRKINK